ADSVIAANPAIAAAKAICAALSHPIVASNRSAPPGSRGIDYPDVSNGLDVLNRSKPQPQKVRENQYQLDCTSLEQNRVGYLTAVELETSVSMVTLLPPPDTKISREEDGS
ncbi:hypothetical protein L195_g051793, partial [Trifolium pratense]